MTSSHRAPAPRGVVLSAHRRSASRTADGARRARRHRTGGRRSATRVLPVAVGVFVLGLGTVAGPTVVGGGFFGGGSDAQRFRPAGLPADLPAEGMIYGDLIPAANNSLCAGAYEIDELTCTHGPDAAPPGLRVARDVAPVTRKAPAPKDPERESVQVPQDAEIVRDEGGSLLTDGKPALLPDAAPGDADFVMGNHGVACEGDGRSGKRVQVLYVHEFGTPSRFTDFAGSIRVWSAGVDAIYDASAGETGGSRHIRYVTTPSCRVDVAEVQLPREGLTSFRKSIGALRTLGYDRTDRKYLLFADANVYCGISTFVPDDRPGAGNRNNGGPAYARVDSGCWSTAMAAHQLTHAFGAMLRGSPHAAGVGDCTDDHDLLCSGKPGRAACPKNHENRLDCGHDDYFSLNPPKRGYLAQHWNVARSEFLLRSDGGDDVPDAGGAVAPVPVEEPAAPPSTAPPAPAPDASAAPGGDASDGGGDAPVTPPAEDPSEEPAPPPAAEEPPHGQESSPAAGDDVPVRQEAVLEVREPSSTSVRLTWSSAGRGARYVVAVDGVPIATTVATRARLIGLRPDAKYVVTIRNDKAEYLAKGTAETPPAARPAQNSWFVLENALTGGAADLYAARSASGTAITLGGSDGNAQQQWKLVPQGGGSFSLRSLATGKCAVPLDGNPVAGAPLVQGECAGDDGGRWTLQLSGYGFTLRSTVGDLVVGVGEQRFGAQRLLVLQNPDRSRHQSWIAVPG
jgi:hypothetical protein